MRLNIKWKCLCHYIRNTHSTKNAKLDIVEFTDMDDFTHCAMGVISHPYEQNLEDI